MHRATEGIYSTKAAATAAVVTGLNLSRANELFIDNHTQPHTHRRTHKQLESMFAFFFFFLLDTTQAQTHTHTHIAVTLINLN